MNPTLQSANLLSPANPQCWTPEGFGSNTASFAWSPSGGPNGHPQETVNESNFSSGDAKLVTTFDLGQCAPTAVAGETYALSASYKSDSPVFFTVYGRSATGTWAYWTGGALPSPPPVTGRPRRGPPRRCRDHRRRELRRHHRP